MTYPHDKVTPYEEDTKVSKKEQIVTMFNAIAGTYDLLNRVLSWRIDIRWRRRLLKELRRVPHKKILDVATGTGDLAIAIARAIPNTHIEGVDLADKMIALANQKVARCHLTHQIHNQVGDAESLVFEKEFFDVVTVAFGIRNFEHLDKGLLEMKRVLKHGGTLFILEFSKPPAPLVHLLYRIYSRLLIGSVGRWLSKDKKAYTYLHQSSDAFLTPQALTKVLEALGFGKVRHQALSFGICTLYEAVK